MAGDPFTVLTAVVAPAVLTNASSVLALGTNNRLARVADRVGIVAAELPGFEPGSEDYEAWTAQFRILQRRAQLLLKALRLFYAGLGLFAASAIVSVGGSIAAYYGQEIVLEAAAAIGILTGTLGVVALVFGCTLVVRETQHTVQNLTEEVKLQSRKVHS
jgi:Protein of unknown function (DUF2721)